MAAPASNLAQPSPAPPKWYHRTIVVGLALLFFFPLGAILLWTAPRTSLLTKLGGTLFFGLVFLAVIRDADHTAKPHATDTSNSSVEPSMLYQMTHPSQPAEPTQATRVPIATLLSEYGTNEVRADAAHKGKWITTTGIVGEVKKDILGNVYVTIGTGNELEIPEVQCFAADDQIGAVARFSKGNKVTATGRVDGLMMNVLVKDCRFQ